jgi:hypothetical protein
MCVCVCVCVCECVCVCALCKKAHPARGSAASPERARVLKFFSHRFLAQRLPQLLLFRLPQRGQVQHPAVHSGCFAGHVRQHSFVAPPYLAGLRCVCVCVCVCVGGCGCFLAQRLRACACVRQSPRACAHSGQAAARVLSCLSFCRLACMNFRLCSSVAFRFKRDLVRAAARRACSCFSAVCARWRGVRLLLLLLAFAAAARPATTALEFMRPGWPSGCRCCWRRELLSRQ